MTDSSVVNAAAVAVGGPDHRSHHRRPLPPYRPTARDDRLLRKVKAVTEFLDGRIVVVGTNGHRRSPALP
jgi:hypothetical protein